MTGLTYFTVTADYLPSTDDGKLSGSVEFTMLVQSGNVLAVPSLTSIVVPTMISGTIDDGVLCDTSGSPGVQLLANTSVLNLTGNLYYQVTYSNVRYRGPGQQLVSETLNSFTFQAPTTATTIDLSTVTPAAGTVAQQLASLPSSGITDATTIGRQVLTAPDAATIRSDIGAAGVPSAGLVKSTGSALAPAVSGTDYQRAHWVNVLDYGADPTGIVDSTTALTNAIAALPSAGGWVYAPAGSYKITSSLSMQDRQGLRGDGPQATVFNYTGTGPCITATNRLPVVPTGTPFNPVGFVGFGINGFGAGTGAGGLQVGCTSTATSGSGFGYLIGSFARDIYIQGFNTTGGFAIKFANSGPNNGVACEKNSFTNISLMYNRNAVIFDNGSFDYSEFQFFIVANSNGGSGATGGTGVTLQNGANPGGSRLSIRGNFSGAGAGIGTPGYVLGIDPGNTSGTSRLVEANLDIATEFDVASIYTIVMGSTQAISQLQAVGSLVNSGIGCLGVSLAAPGNFNFSGYVNDSVLGTYTTGVFTRTAKSFAYTAMPWQLVVCNATSAAFTVTLPTAPPNGTMVAVKKTDASANAVTWSCGGSDVINVAGGATSGTLPYQYQGVVLEYDATTAIWTVVGDDLPLSAVASSTATYTNKTMSGAANTFSNIPLSALASAAYSASATASTLAERDPSGILFANNYVASSYSQAASSTTLALGAGSPAVIIITGTTQNQVITLPPGGNVGQSWKVINETTAATVTCNGFTSGTAAVIPPGGDAVFTALSSTPTTAASWQVDPPGGGIAVTQGGALGTPASGVLTNCSGLPVAGGGTGASTAAAALANLAAGGIPSNLLPNGILNANSAQQAQATVAGTNYYLTNSQLILPATYLQGMVAPSGSGGTVKCGTVFRWRVVMTKNAQGTGSFALLVFRGTNGTTADTADVSQTIGAAMSAVADTLTVDVQVTVVTTGATGSYYWSMTAVHSGASTTGFGLGASIGAPVAFSGTVSSVPMNTASLVFGLGFVCGTGGTLPTIAVPTVQAQAFNID